MGPGLYTKDKTDIILIAPYSYRSAILLIDHFCDLLLWCQTLSNQLLWQWCFFNSSANASIVGSETDYFVTVVRLELRLLTIAFTKVNPVRIFVVFWLIF